MPRYFLVCLLLGSVGVGGFGGCTSLQETELLLEAARQHQETMPTLKWQKDLPGKPTDFSLSALSDKGLGAFAVVPDKQYPKPLEKPQILLYDPMGKLVTTKILSARVRHLSISDDGSRIIYNSYEQELYFLNRGGKILAKHEEHCRPLVANGVQEILCFFDDDNESSRIFVRYNWQGQVMGGLQLKDETALDLGLLGPAKDPDVGVSFVGGKFNVYERKGKLKWKVNLPGEIVDFKSLDIAETPAKILVLQHKYLLKEGLLKDQRMITLLDAQGKILAHRSLNGSFKLLECNGNSDKFYLYGNGVEGQRLEQWQIKGNDIEKNWSHHVPTQLEFLIPLILDSSGRVFAAFGGLYRRTDGGYHTSILGFSPSGNKDWEVDVPVREMGLRFGVQSPNLLWVWTEEGRLSVYSL